MHITPEMMEATYRLLCTTLPFRRWKMPHPDKIIFRVLATKERYGHWAAYVNADEVGEMAVSPLVTNLDLLTRTIAHEMVHIRQEHLGHRDHHGVHFRRIAGTVCRRHGWDLVNF